MSDARDTMQAAVRAADEQRVKRLGLLHAIQVAKIRGLERELVTLTARYGADSERVKLAQARIAARRRYAGQLAGAMENPRAQAAIGRVGRSGRKG